MTTKAQKIRVGAFIMVTAALLAVVIVLFGGVRLFKNRAKYTIVFETSVMGLEKGARVYMNGIKAGNVEDVSISEVDMTKVVVTIAVDEKTPVRTDTTAMLQYAGITGLKVIDLRGGTSTAAKLPEGGVIPRGQTLLDKLEDKALAITGEAEKIMQRATTIADNVATLTDPKRFAPIDDILASSRTAASNLSQTSGMMKAMVAENRVALRQTMESARAATESTRDIISTQVTGLVGSAGEMLADLKGIIHGSQGYIRSAVYDLRQASRNFKEMSRDVRQKPSRLLFSSSPAERKLP